MRTRQTLLLSVTVLMTMSLPSVLSADRPALESAIQVAIAELGVCDPQDSLTACNEFVCKALERAYGANAAIDLKSGGKCAVANDMHKSLFAIANGTKKPKGIMTWTLIGTADDNAVLERAQACANEGFATLVSSSGAEHGHIVIVVPGQLELSNTWQTLVPVVAGRRLGVVGQPQETANSNQIKLSAHWSKDSRKDAFVFVEGFHKRAPQSSGCQ